MPESEEVTVEIKARLLQAAVNSNPSLRIPLTLVQPPKPDSARAYFGTDMPGFGGEGARVLISIPDELWAMLGRRRDLIARLTLPDDE